MVDDIRNEVVVVNDYGKHLTSFVYANSTIVIERLCSNEDK